MPNTEDYMNEWHDSQCDEISLGEEKKDQDSHRCNRPEFPPSQFFPRGKNGPAHSFPGEKIGRPILSPPSQFFPPLIISKIIMELLFLCINLKSRY